jgi:mono/diheme cytochrome c family protein
MISIISQLGSQRMLTPSRAIAFASAALFFAATTCTSFSAETLQQRGEVIARGLCSQCHAIGRQGDSPHPAAPRFRTLDDRIDLSTLSRRIRGGLLTGHQDMPMFRFGRDDADAMVAYIRSIQGP